MKLRHRIDQLGEQMCLLIDVLQNTKNEQHNFSLGVSVRRELGKVKDSLGELGYEHVPPPQYSLDTLIKLSAREAAQSSQSIDVAGMVNAVQIELHKHGPALQQVCRASGAKYIEEAVAWDFLTERIQAYLFGPETIHRE